MLDETPSTDARPTDAEIAATCERWSTQGQLSLVEVVGAMVADITRDIEACKNTAVSMGEFNVYKYKAATYLRTLLELAEGNYFGDGFNLDEYRRERGRIDTAFKELVRVFNERNAYQSPQARAGEAQLSARHIEETNHPGDFPRLLNAFPDLNALARQENGRRVIDYTIEDVGFKPPELEKLERGTVLEENLGFREVIEMLAQCKRNLREHPNPPAYVRYAVNREWRRKLSRYKKEFGQSPEPPDEGADQFFDTHCDLSSPADVNEGANNVELAVAEREFNQALGKAGLSLDQIRVVNARINGLDLRSSKAPQILGMTPTRLDSVRRSLEPNRKAGKALLRFARSLQPSTQAPTASD